MRKSALILAVVFIVGMLLSTMPFAAAIPISVVVDGKDIDFPDSQPFIDTQGRTQTPARFIGEALGATASWDGKAKKATFEKGGKKLILYIGKKEYELNGQKKQMDTAALLKESRTFVPARYVAEAFGATVRWDGAIKVVYIDTSKVPQPTSTPGGTRNVAGFIVPEDIELMVAADKYSTSCDLSFTLHFLRGDIEKQKDDAEKILLQRFGQDTVKQIMDHIRPKIDSDYVIEEKVIYDKKADQYIVIPKSDGDAIILEIYKKGVKPSL